MKRRYRQDGFLASAGRVAADHQEGSGPAACDTATTFASDLWAASSTTRKLRTSKASSRVQRKCVAPAGAGPIRRHDRLDKSKEFEELSGSVFDLKTAFEITQPTEGSGRNQQIQNKLSTPER
jgi:hypothetical protein